MKNTLACVSAALLLGACAAPSAPPASVAPSAQAPLAAPSKPVATAALPAAQLPPYKDPTNILYKERTVYFDFDSYTVKPVYNTALAAHGKFLGSAPSIKIRVEGNTDERGGAEYNLALGQKRAEALKKALVVQGAKEAQIEAISYGKEKPLAAGHDEAAWSQNRRAGIVYP
ncbi:peptidoglycan-associated lipoprotein Pal [Duganella hordei]|uniref:peptidoglycan-associated lipoprotein Pal n=1 Tax=Duganella hordei TaxID=2865934 RepID=UPI0030E7B951